MWAMPDQMANMMEQKIGHQNQEQISVGAITNGCSTFNALRGKCFSEQKIRSKIKLRWKIF